MLPRTTGWYVHPDEGSFNKLAAESGTDKVTSHDYGILYSRAFLLPTRKPQVAKLLEIGLGCNMAYGPGASAKLWRNMFPAAEIWFAEVDHECVTKNRDKVDAAGIKVVVGDQENVNTLRTWVLETGGNFDVIVDDGGHSNGQQYNSFMMLFQHALKPGGLYVIEDLSTSRSPWGGTAPSMISVIKDWIELLTDSHKLPDAPMHAYNATYLMPPGIRSIECIAEACAFVKCYADDARCAYHATMVNASLAVKYHVLPVPPQ